jgi:hypothetical protein
LCREAVTERDGWWKDMAGGEEEGKGTSGKGTAGIEPGVGVVTANRAIGIASSIW